jgi:hypothetical protein
MSGNDEENQPPQPNVGGGARVGGVFLTDDQFQQLISHLTSNNGTSTTGTPNPTGTTGTSVPLTPPRSSAIKPQAVWHDVDSKEGMRQFKEATKRPDNVPLRTLTVNNKEPLITHCSSHAITHGYDQNLQVPTLTSTASGLAKNGAVKKSAAGHESVEFEFGPTAHIFDEQHKVNEQGVLYLAHWMFGRWDQDMSAWTRDQPPNPLPAKEIQELNLNLDPNDSNVDLERVVSDVKQRYRIISQLIFFTLQNLIHPDSWKSILIDKSNFTWTNVQTQEKVYEGFWVFYKVLRLISPAVVVDHQALLETLHSLTMSKSKYNVATLLSQLQETRQKIQAHGGLCTDQTFLTAFFKALQTGNNAAFNKVVKEMETAWQMGDPTEIPIVSSKLLTYYNNLVTNRKWGKTDDQGTNPSSSEIALLTKQVDEQAKRIRFLEGEKKSEKPAPNAGAGSAQKKGPWRTTNVGKTTKHPETGEEMVWCPHHGKNGGCYMPKGHNHEEWLKEREEKSARRSKRTRDSERSSSPAPKSLKLNEKHKTALCTAFATKLTTAFNMDDAEAMDFIKNGINDANQQLN